MEFKMQFNLNMMIQAQQTHSQYILQFDLKMGNCGESKDLMPVIKCEQSYLEVYQSPANKIKIIWVDDGTLDQKNKGSLLNFQSFANVKSFQNSESATAFLKESKGSDKFNLILSGKVNESKAEQIMNDNKIKRAYILTKDQNERDQAYTIDHEKLARIQTNIVNLLRSVRFDNLPKVQAKKYRTVFLKPPDNDFHHIRKARINYKWLTKQQPKDNLAKRDFLQLTQIYTEDKQIKNSLQSYNSVLKWAIKDSFVWQSISELPLLTSDPKQLAYLRLPFRALSAAIKKEYKFQETRIYVVACISKEQEKLLKDDHFLTFATFMKGFTNQDKAKDHQRRLKNSYIFQIVCVPLDLEKEFDAGYYIYKSEQENVLINIGNYFKILEVKAESRQVEMQYGGLADIAAKAKHRFGMSSQQNELYVSSNYLYWIQRNANQGTAFRLQKQYNECLQYYAEKNTFLRQNGASEVQIAKNMLDKANFHTIQKNYQEAEKTIQQVQSSAGKGSQIHLYCALSSAQLYYQSQKKTQFQQRVEFLRDNLEQFKKQDLNQALEAMNYISTSLIQRGQHKLASELIEDIIKILQQNQENKLDGNPIYNDALRNKAICLSNRQSNKEAEILLEITSRSIKKCEGESSKSLKITNSMMTSVRSSNLTLSATPFVRIKRSDQQAD